MIDTQHEINVAGVKISIAWIVWLAGVINITTILTIISTLLVIVYTGLQIYKLWREIKKDIRSEEFAKKMSIDPPTIPSVLGKD